MPEKPKPLVVDDWTAAECLEADSGERRVYIYSRPYLEPITRADVALDLGRWLADEACVWLGGEVDAD